MERRLACLSALPHITVSKWEGEAGYQHKAHFLALLVFLILSQSRSKQLWGECESFALGHMLKSCCALSWLRTQWWFALTCNSSGTAASPGVLQVLQMRLAKAPSITMHSPALGSTLVSCYKGFGQTPFFPKESQHSSLIHHKVQIRITFLDNEPDSWPQAQLLGLAGEAYNSHEICPEHTVEQEEHASCPSKKLTAVRGDGCARPGWSTWWCLN